MSRKFRYSKDTMLQAIYDYKNGIKSIAQIHHDLGCSKHTVYWWIKAYESYGEEVLDNKPQNKAYSKELKEQIIKEYQNGQGSSTDLAFQYKISSKSIVSKWVFNYNNGIEVKDYDPKHEVYTMKTRKTTLDERAEIVKYCIDNKQNYKLAAEKYNVPYSLVYQWVHRFLKEGDTALSYSKKGPHKKVVVPTTDQERLQMENERLKHELERKELEIEILKKKQYFAELLYSPKSNKKNRT